MAGKARYSAHRTRSNPCKATVEGENGDDGALWDLLHYNDHRTTLQ